MKIYLICSVRDANEESKEKAESYVAHLEGQGHTVHYPPRDVDQTCDTGISIVDAHRAAMAASDEVHLIWDVESKGSHFDLGMAVAFNKKIVLKDWAYVDIKGKSYLKVIKELQERGRDHTLGICELLAMVGEDNVTVQSLHQSLAGVNKLKDGVVEVSFYTEPTDITKIANGDRVGFVCWFDRDKLGKE